LTNERLQTAGSILFLVCAPLFLISGLRSGDIWTIAASIVFGIGVIMFLIPERTTD
jgi:hypothetical protein|tara:strand:+ start:374 stop:541 length:168 start_codon:yes stop_codon:yes gene_type:complete